MTGSEIGFLGLALIVGAGIWFRTMEAREHANAAVAATCRRADSVKNAPSRAVRASFTLGEIM